MHKQDIYNVLISTTYIKRSACYPLDAFNDFIDVYELEIELKKESFTSI